MNNDLQKSADVIRSLNPTSLSVRLIPPSSEEPDGGEQISC